MFQYTNSRPFRRLPQTACLLTALVIAGCGPVNVQQIQEQKNAKQLPAADVLKLVEGNTLFFHSFSEESYFYYAPNGTLFGQDIYNNKDTGKWDVTNTAELCMKLQRWWYGDLRCFPVHSDGQKYYLANDAGVLEFTVDLLPGDAKKQFREMKKEERASYRRSIRTQPPAPGTAPESVPQTAAEPAPPAAEKAPAPPVAEEVRSQPVPPASPEELKSTVKWMAKDCPGCNLSGSNLKKADLVGAKLQGADLSGANLSMANLRRADPQGANLTGADLSFANLPGADLRGSNLKQVNFKGANLIKADLTGAQLEGADFSEALVEGTVGLPR